MKCGLVVSALAIGCATVLGCSLPREAVGAPDAVVGLDGGRDARVTPDMGTDARVDVGVLDGGPDGGFDGGLDGGLDAGIDGGLDGGNDGGTDGGTDGGHDGGMDAPDLNGHSCTTSGTCASGICVDGVCCASACAGLCERCDGPTPGTCTPVASGTDPSDECAMQSASTCGTTGSCDGARACARYDATTICAAASCTAGSASAASMCSGSGLCTPPTPTSCAPYVCGATACRTTCGSNADCTGGTRCNAAGACFTPSANGAACTTGNDCASTFCVDGFCCNGACSGVCQACSAALRGTGVNGTCGSIAAGMDPEDECASQSASTCGRTGTCDGGGACALYADGTVCGNASCAGNVVTSAPTCSGGACGVGTPSSCTPYTCSSATACGTSCTLDTNCVGGDYCSGGVCVPTLPPGASCTTNNQCSSGPCVDGVCCNTSCVGTCQACTLTRTGLPDGLCGPVRIATDPDNECPTDPVSTCGRTGSCNGVGGCTVYPDGTTCGNASCSGSSITSAPTCTGGACGGGTTSTCAPYDCASATSCGASCVGDGNCTSGNYCSGGMCVPQLSGGAACSGNNVCSGGHCVDGVCCNTGCAGTCQACSNSRTGQADGTCANVSNNTDPDNECAGLLVCFNGGCI